VEGRGTATALLLVPASSFGWPRCGSLPTTLIRQNGKATFETPAGSHRGCWRRAFWIPEDRPEKTKRLRLPAAGSKSPLA